MTRTIEDRRYWLRAAGTTAVALWGCSRSEHESDEAEVTPGEDLMQEHGVVERILLVYDESARRIEAHETADLGVIVGAASIVKRFIEEYHEQNEEHFVFPRLRKAQRETELVDVLLKQHESGRRVTAEILRGAAASGTPELARLLRSFTRMYRPHAAREDTVLFPAFRSVVGKSGYHELGEQFEEDEHKRFGEHGFENAVAEVAKLESALGLADLATFTPP